MSNKGFGPTHWAINNKVSVFVLAAILVILGMLAYTNLPKEQFPEIVVPTIYVQTIYAGTSPDDIETLITKPIEQQLKSVSGVKKITSQSVQDYSAIVVEFNTGIDPAVAKQRVADKVDIAKKDLPTDMDQDPIVQEIDFSEMPIMTINISGNYSLDVLKNYADDLQDRIESLPQITRADMIGALDKEVQVNMDLYRMTAANVSFNDVYSAIKSENINIGGGNLDVGSLERSIRVTGQFDNVAQIGNILISNGKGEKIYLRDIADVEFTNADRSSYARMNKQPVIALSVIKRSGENLIEASDNINAIIEDMKANVLPDDINIKITGDLSANTRVSINDLINSVIIGFILVTVVLMFFMGVSNSIYVGLAVPLSTAISFILLPPLDFTFNIIVTFSFLLGLGIVVDNAIVVIENTYRLHFKEGLPIKEAANTAAGQVFKAVISGTLAHLAPFFPLLFWPGIMGDFMFFMPAVLIILLTASLFVAYFFNPVFAVQFMDRVKQSVDKKSTKSFYLISLGVFLFGLLLSLSGASMLGNLIIISLVLFFFNKYFLTPVVIRRFEHKFIPWLIGSYRKLLTWMLKGKRPISVVLGVVATLVISIIIFAINTPKIEFFPDPDPNNVIVYLELPLGTRAEVTDSVTAIVEDKVIDVVGKDNPIVKSVISNVGVGAGDPMNPDRSVKPNKGKVTVAFVEYAERHGESTWDYMDKIRKAVGEMAGVDIKIDKEQSGPPTGKPINVEIRGDDFDKLIALSKQFKYILVDSLDIQGIENLQSDLELNKPEILIDINREKANREGLTTTQISMALRTALYGLEVSKYRTDDEDYPIQLRLKEEYRQNLDQLMNMKLTFREKDGSFHQVPISAFADIKFQNTFGGINRKDVERTVTLSSNVLAGYNSNQINKEILKAAAGFDLPTGYEIRLTGEQEQQKETGDFLAKAFMISILLVFFILVTMFNSVIKPLIIFTTILFSVIGVLLGYALTGMDFVIVMSGVGIIALAGIVVNNGILLLDFTDIRLKEGMKPASSIVDGGAVRLQPVLLTATATMLGLVPLAFGLNINFATLITDFSPNISFGSDSTVFWAPLSWAIIFGLTFSTFLTLLVVPTMYAIQFAMKQKYSLARSRGKGMVGAMVYTMFGKRPKFAGQ
jgi:multidrug efflux pump subunit AcrB